MKIAKDMISVIKLLMLVLHSLFTGQIFMTFETL